MSMPDKYLPEKSRGERVWERVLRASLALPGAKVDRASFLTSQLSSYCDEEQIRKAIQFRPAMVGIPSDMIDKLSDSCIRSHILKAASISFAAGLPGGFAMAGTIPADMAQFYWHALVLSQKLAYLYGWPDLLEEGEVDEETELHLTLLIGAMMGAVTAKRGLAELAARFAEQVARRLPRQALTKTVYYPTVKKVAAWIGIKVTKRTFAGGVAKVIPVVGGVVSAGMTAAMMRPMAKRLKNHLRTLRYALPDEHETRRRIPS